MRTRIIAFVGFVGFVAASLTGLAADDAASSTFSSVRPTIEQALGFLRTDAEKWRAERQCATCHHGTFTVWTMAEARRAGFAVDSEFLADSLTWTKTKLERVDDPRGTEPGRNMMNSPLIYLALMNRLMPDEQILSEQEARQIEGHLLRHQEQDGSWSWSMAPAKNRPPPFFESDEVATLLVLTVLADREATPSAELQHSRAKAAQWLARTPPNDTTQAAALRLLHKSAQGPSDALLPSEIGKFLSLQQPDGGWAQLKDRPSDAYATGQALYVLSLAGVPPQRTEIRRGVEFLVATQQADGSWPMTRRGHEGVTPSDFVIPINYFGAAWATLGLIRSAN